MIDKFINFKICKNGTFQMTGCKSKKHAIECVKIVWKLIKDKDLYTFKSDDTFFKCIFIPSMRNIDFNLGFTVDREKFNKYMSEQEEFRCLLETSFGYTGLNIKLLLENDINNMKTTVLEYKAAPRRGGSAAKEDFYLKQSTYKEYLKLLTKKERKTKLETKRYHTFLVFHSGSCIFSGLTEEFMKPVYETFVKIIRKARPHIEERLDTT